DHRGIRTTTGDPGAAGTPCDVIERDGVALQDLLTLSPFRVPQPESGICTATEQSPAIRQKSEGEHRFPMPIEDRPIGMLFHVPEPDRCIKAGARQGSSVRAPDDCLDSISMSDQCLE